MLSRFGTSMPTLRLVVARGLPLAVTLLLHTFCIYRNGLWILYAVAYVHCCFVVRKVEVPIWGLQFESMRDTGTRVLNFCILGLSKSYCGERFLVGAARNAVVFLWTNAHGSTSVSAYQYQSKVMWS